MKERGGALAHGPSKSGSQRYRNALQVQSVPDSDRELHTSSNFPVASLDVSGTQDSNQMTRDYATAPLTAVNSKRHSYAT